MKKMNRKGFTLIELLAVITIMGILMMAAIPAVSRTIENSRRDTFAENVRTYINTVRNAVLADELKCGAISVGEDGTVTTPQNSDLKSVSGMPDGTFYFVINTDDEQTTNLMESVAKSSWGNSDLVGYISWSKINGKTAYYAFVSDTANHGMFAEQAELEIKRSTVVANIPGVADGSGGSNTSITCGTGTGQTACEAATTASRPTAYSGAGSTIYQCKYDG